MNYYKNGILIQQINEKNIFLKKYADSFFTMACIYFLIPLFPI